MHIHNLLYEDLIEYEDTSRPYCHLNVMINLFIFIQFSRMC